MTKLHIYINYSITFVWWFLISVTYLKRNFPLEENQFKNNLYETYALKYESCLGFLLCKKTCSLKCMKNFDSLQKGPWLKQSWDFEDRVLHE